MIKVLLFLSVFCITQNLRAEAFFDGVIAAVEKAFPLNFVCPNTHRLCLGAGGHAGALACCPEKTECTVSTWRDNTNGRPECKAPEAPFGQEGDCLGACEFKQGEQNQCLVVLASRCRALGGKTTCFSACNEDEVYPECRGACIYDGKRCQVMNDRECHRENLRLPRTGTLDFKCDERCPSNINQKFK